MCEIWIDDPCSVWVSSKVSRARKKHRCEDCGATVLPGQSYWRLFSVYDGKGSSSKSCVRCKAARKVFMDAHGSEYGPPALEEMLDACIADGDEESERKWKPILRSLQRRKRQARRSAS